MPTHRHVVSQEVSVGFTSVRQERRGEQRKGQVRSQVIQLYLLPSSGQSSPVASGKEKNNCMKLYL